MEKWSVFYNYDLFICYFEITFLQSSCVTTVLVKENSIKSMPKYKELQCILVVSYFFKQKKRRLKCCCFSDELRLCVDTGCGAEQWLADKCLNCHPHSSVIPKRMSSLLYVCVYVHALTAHPLTNVCIETQLRCPAVCAKVSTADIMWITPSRNICGDYDEPSVEAALCTYQVTDINTV